MANEKIENDVSSLTNRVEALESRNAFQDDLIEQLNDELAIHQAQIAELQLQLKLVAERIKDGTSPSSEKMEQEPPPPHY